MFDPSSLQETSGHWPEEIELITVYVGTILKGSFVFPLGTSSPVHYPCPTRVRGN